jgi:hypothetical protein
MEHPTRLNITLAGVSAPHFGANALQPPATRR